MPQELRSIRKLGLNAHQAAGVPRAVEAMGADVLSAPVPHGEAAGVVATLQLSVTKTGGPVATFVEVGSSGDDDQVFNDSQLDPGPVRMRMLQENSYTVVWRGAFVAAGSATLHVLIEQSDGTVIMQDNVDISHPPTNSPFTIVVM